MGDFTTTVSEGIFLVEAAANDSAQNASSAPSLSIMHESLAQFHHYTEGVVLTPISVFGVIGE